MSEYILEMMGIKKSFPGVMALNGVDLKIKKGEIHALMGENGAGKSTLIKILTGLYKKDFGRILFDGSEIDPSSSIEAQSLGISTIYQEVNIIPSLSVCENIFAGREIKKGFTIDWKETEKKAKELLNSLGIDIDVKALMGSYSTAIKQMISIARAISVKAKLVVMDEPTSSLNEEEVKVLFSIINKLKAEGISIIFISHKLNEIFEISDTITVLKDGELVGEYETKNLTKLDLISKMIGKNAHAIENQKKSYSEFKEDVFLQAKNITSGVRLNAINLTVRKGEVVGLAGLLGSGRTEIARVLFGADKFDKGSIEINGKQVYFKLPRDAISLNMAFCSEDRKQEGIIPYMSVKDNMTLAILKDISRFGLISRKKQSDIVSKYIKAINIKTPSHDQGIRYLSGGNQQKVLLARWICKNPELIILDEPTRGIDVGAKSEIISIIEDLSNNGIGVIVISSEFDELIRCCDRIEIIRDGKNVGSLKSDEINEDNILSLIAGPVSVEGA